LVGEPTSHESLGDTIKIGRRGSLSGLLTVQRGAGPHRLPAHSRRTRYTSLRAGARRTRGPALDEGNAYFQPTSFQVANIARRHRRTLNVIPGELKVRFNLRFSTEQTVASLQRAVLEILDRHRAKYSLDWIIAGLPFLTEPGVLTEAVSTAVNEVTGHRPPSRPPAARPTGRFIAPTGAQVVELGVGNATIHKVNECARVSDIEQLSVVYERVMEKLLI